MVTKVFLDTEFTDFNQPNLISIGLVTEDGLNSFYVELVDAYTMMQCSYFVHEWVLPLLDAKPMMLPLDYSKVYAKMTIDECREHLRLWFEHLEDHIVIYNDAPQFDWTFLKTLLGDAWPLNLKRECQLIAAENEIMQQRYNNTIYEAYRNGYREHHAMDDAIVMGMGWRVINRL